VISEGSNVRPVLLSTIGFAFVAAASAEGQTCSDQHYRWTEKTDESVASLTPVRAYITTMHTSWGLLPYTGQAQYKCADRTSRELKVCAVTGWSAASGEKNRTDIVDL
jgi:hypothetical protein